MATNVVNVYQAGQPVTVTVTATIAHPGWWRISLRQGAAAPQNGTNFPDPPELGAPGSDQPMHAGAHHQLHLVAHAAGTC